MLALYSVLIAFVWLNTAHAQLGSPKLTAADNDAIYAFTDDRGRLVQVQRLADVPPHLRATAKRVDVPDDEHSGEVPQPTEGEEPVVYRYRTAQGGVIFTNLWTSVPIDQRANARVDLRQVSLHSELGRSIDQQLEQHFDALQAGDTCAQLRAAASTPWWTPAFWSRASPEHRPLWLCGLAALLLLAASPWMLSKGWGGSWARVLQTGIPVLAAVALSAFVLIRLSRSSEALQTTAQDCKPEAWQQKKTLPQRLKLVQALEAEKQALAQIEAESR